MPDDDNEDSIMVIETAVSLKTHGCLLLFVKLCESDCNTIHLAIDEKFKDKIVSYFMTKKESRTVKPIKGLTVRLFIMAERVGFEPTRPFGLTDFESAPL